MKNILIIEDSKLQQKILVNYLKELNYNILATFSYGQKALDYIENNQEDIDLVLIDIILKGEINGYDVSKAISKNYGIPMIYLTSVKEEKSDYNFNESDVYLFLNKPFTKLELKNNIEMVLSKHRLNKKLENSLNEKQMLLDNIETMVWYLKSPDTFARVNKAYTEFFGLAKKNIEGKKLKDVLGIKDANHCLKTNREVFNKKKQIKNKKYIENKNNVKKILIITKTPWINDKGEVEFVICSAKDITEEEQKNLLIKEKNKKIETLNNKVNNLFGYGNIVFWSIDLKENRLINITGPTEEIYGYNKEQFYDNPALLKQAVVEKDKAKIKEEKISLRKYGDSKKTDVEYRIKAKDNKEKWVRDITMPIFKNGRIVRFDGLIIDITQRKKTEKKLKDTKKSLEMALQGANLGFWDWNIENDEIKYNDIWAKMIGYEKSELKNNLSVWYNLIHPEDKKEVEKELEDHLAGKTEYYKKEHRVKTKDGNYKWINDVGKVLKRDEDGKPLRALGIHQDIHKRKLTEKKVKETKRKLELIFENMENVIFLVDVLDDDTFVYEKANMAHQKLSRLKGKDVSNKSPVQLLGEEHGQRVKTKYRKCIVKKETIEYEEIIEDKGETKIWLTKLSPVIINGKVEKIAGTSFDITERKRRERRIKYISYHDELTDLYNRRYFEVEMDRLNESRQLPITIIIGDLDKLKIINDNYGHKMGDRYLKEVGHLLEKVTRHEDIVARIGGDEFAFLLPETDAKDAECFCNRLNRKFSEYNKECKLPEEISISLGYAVKNNNNQNLSKIFEKADHNMYINKGRL